MKRSHILAAVVFAALFTSGAAAQDVSCTSYLWDLCFLAGSGDRVTTSFPADFVINEIELASGAHITTYEGLGLADPEQAGIPVELRAYQAAGVLVRVYASTERSQRGRYFSLRYGARGNQVFGWFSTAQERAAIAEFLSTFHACQRGQPNFASVVCTAEPVFKEGAEVISTLRADTN